MHIKIAKSALTTALSTVQSVVESKSAMQVLQNVKVSAADGKATFVCSNLDITVKCSVDCEIIEAGATTLPVKILSTAIGKVIDGLVEIEVKDDKAAIQAGVTKFKLNGIPANEFPELPGVSGDKITLTAKGLREILRKTAFAMSVDETRRALNGVLFDIKGKNELVAVATDGRRLSLLKTTAEIPDNLVRQIIFPRKSVDILRSKLAKDGNVTICISNTLVSFAFENTVIYTTIMDTKYPNYEAVIPTEAPYMVSVSRTELMEAIDRISVFASEAGSSSMQVKFADNAAVLTAKDSEYGGAMDEVPIKYSGESITMTMNPTYVKDALAALDEDEVEIHLKNEKSPAIISKVGESDFTYVCMPLRVNKA